MTEYKFATDDKRTIVIIEAHHFQAAFEQLCRIVKHPSDFNYMD